MRYSKKLAAAAALLACFGGPVRAADHEAQAWLATSAKLRIDEKWAVKLEAEGRFTDDLQRYGQTQLKATLSRKLGSQITAGLGYGHMISNASNAPDIHENRIWQELTWKPETNTTVEFALRARLEQRFFSNGDDVGWRFRQRAMATRPVSDDFYLYGYGEAFFYLNDTDWGADSGFARWRTGAGAGLELSPKATLEGGYINQYEPVSDGPDDMAHIFLIAFSLKS